MDNNLGNNLRIPEIGEFVDGFVYEIYSEGYWDESVEDFCGWYCYAWPYDGCGRELEDIEIEISLGNVRVKCCFTPPNVRR